MLGFIKDRATKVIEDAKSIDLSAVTGAVGKGLERVQTNFDALMEDDERIGRGSMALARFETVGDTNAALKALNALMADSAVIVPEFANTIVFVLSETLPVLAVAKGFKPTVLLV